MINESVLLATRRYYKGYCNNILWYNDITFYVPIQYICLVIYNYFALKAPKHILWLNWSWFTPAKIWQPNLTSMFMWPTGRNIADLGWVDSKGRFTIPPIFGYGIGIENLPLKVDSDTDSRLVCVDRAIVKLPLLPRSCKTTTTFPLLRERIWCLSEWRCLLFSKALKIPESVLKAEQWKSK